jgi:hypothetical protein
MMIRVDVIPLVDFMFGITLVVNTITKSLVFQRTLLMEVLEAE